MRFVRLYFAKHRLFPYLIRLRVASLHLYKTVSFSIHSFIGLGYTRPTANCQLDRDVPGLLVLPMSQSCFVGLLCKEVILQRLPIESGWCQPFICLGWTEMTPVNPTSLDQDGIDQPLHSIYLS